MHCIMSCPYSDSCRTLSIQAGNRSSFLSVCGKFRSSNFPIFVEPTPPASSNAICNSGQLLKFGVLLSACGENFHILGVKSLGYGKSFVNNQIHDILTDANRLINSLE